MDSPEHPAGSSPKAPAPKAAAPCARGWVALGPCRIVQVSIGPLEPVGLCGYRAFLVKGLRSLGVFTTGLRGAFADGLGGVRVSNREVSRGAV